MTPRLCFDNNYCLEDCCECNKTCPSGAIAHLDLDEKKKTYIGLAKIDNSRCLLSLDRECNACVNSCPYDAIKIRFDHRSYLSFLQIDPQKCIGCGACQATCPTSPIKAITIYPPNKT